MTSLEVEDKTSGVGLELSGHQSRIPQEINAFLDVLIK